MTVKPTQQVDKKKFYDHLNRQKNTDAIPRALMNFFYCNSQNKDLGLTKFTIEEFKMFFMDYFFSQSVKNINEMTFSIFETFKDPIDILKKDILKTSHK
jgi:hypothetical protein